MDALGPGLGDDLLDGVDRVARADDEGAVGGVVEVAEAVGQERPAARPRRPLQQRVDDEQRDDLALPGGGRQRRVVGQAEVAAEPEHRSHDLTLKVRPSQNGELATDPRRF